MAVPTYHENPAEHAARLLTGAGAATMTLGDIPQTPHPVLHGRDTLGTIWVLTHPNYLADTYDTQTGALTIRENAPLASRHLILATLQLDGTLHIGEDTNPPELTPYLQEARQTWPEAHLTRFSPDAITLTTSIGSHTIDPYTACLAEPDPLAAQGTDITDTLSLEFGTKLLPIVRNMSQKHQTDAGNLKLDHIDQLHIICADSQGITMLCHSTGNDWFLRLPFTQRATNLAAARQQLSRFLTCAHSALDKCPYLGRR